MLHSFFGDKCWKCLLHNKAVFVLSLLKALTLITSYLKAMYQLTKAQNSNDGSNRHTYKKNTHLSIDPNAMKIYTIIIFEWIIFLTALINPPVYPGIHPSLHPCIYSFIYPSNKYAISFYALGIVRVLYT